MDFNDITGRIERVYSAIGEVQIKDWQKEVNWSPKGELDITFGPQTITINANKILSVISAIANLKDNLKNKMASAGLDKNLVEIEINNSLCLQLVTDLDNQDKHGYPIRNKRSNKDPLITNIYSSYFFKPDQGATNPTIIEFDMSTQQATSSGGQAKILINADITDKDHNFICSLNSIVDESMETWEQFITLHKLS